MCGHVSTVSSFLKVTFHFTILWTQLARTQHSAQRWLSVATTRQREGREGEPQTSDWERESKLVESTKQSVIAFSCERNEHPTITAATATTTTSVWWWIDPFLALFCHFFFCSSNASLYCWRDLLWCAIEFQHAAAAAEEKTWRDNWSRQCFDSWEENANCRDQRYHSLMFDDYSETIVDIFANWRHNHCCVYAAALWLSDKMSVPIWRGGRKRNLLRIITFFMRKRQKNYSKENKIN